MDSISTGHWIFALLFFIAFIVCMVWAYKKDININRFYFKGAYKLLFAIVLLFLALYLFVKLKI